MLKIGDRVRYLSDANIGEGTIVLQNSTQNYWWVDFDKDHQSGYNADGAGRMGHCYTTTSDRLLRLPNLSPFEIQVRAYITSELHND